MRIFLLIASLLFAFVSIAQTPLSWSMETDPGGSTIVLEPLWSSEQVDYHQFQAVINPQKVILNDNTRSAGPGFARSNFYYQLPGHQAPPTIFGNIDPASFRDPGWHRTDEITYNNVGYRTFHIVGTTGRKDALYNQQQLLCCWRN